MAPETPRDYWDGEEQRRNPPKFTKAEGWSMLKEVWGTFLGALPALLIAGGALMQLYSLVQIHTIEINHLKEADVRHEQMLSQQRQELANVRNEIVIKLDRIDQRLERLGESVAADGARYRSGGTDYQRFNK